MEKLNRDDLFSLETYAEARPAFRAKVLAHKKNRQVAIGPHARLYFEDRLTIQYQIQEMLRIERTFEVAGIEEELDTYNPLIPDGSNLKATFMLEYGDSAERTKALAHLKGVEKSVWIRVADFDPVFAIADEDLERENADKTSAVHFLRFELSPEMAASLKGRANLDMGIQHEHYQHEILSVAENIRASLASDVR